MHRKEIANSSPSTPVPLIRLGRRQREEEEDKKKYNEFAVSKELGH